MCTSMIYEIALFSQTVLFRKLDSFVNEYFFEYVAINIQKPILSLYNYGFCLLVMMNNTKEISFSASFFFF